MTWMSVERMQGVLIWVILLHQGIERLVVKLARRLLAEETLEGAQIVAMDLVSLRLEEE